jgi:hypothetical protein
LRFGELGFRLLHGGLQRGFSLGELVEDGLL